MSSSTPLSSNSDLWLLQNLHRIAIADPKERQAQATVLSTFWSQLQQHQETHARLIQCQNENAILVQQVIEANRQLAQAGFNDDLARSMVAMAELTLVVAGSTGSVAIREEQTQMVLHARELGFAGLQQRNQELMQELEASRVEVCEAHERLNSLQWQLDVALTEKEKVEAEQAVMLQKKQKGRTINKSPRQSINKNRQPIRPKT